jgi:hypothetical protein
MLWPAVMVNMAEAVPVVAGLVLQLMLAVLGDVGGLFSDTVTLALAGTTTQSLAGPLQVTVFCVMVVPALIVKVHDVVGGVLTQTFATRTCAPGMVQCETVSTLRLVPLVATADTNDAGYGVVTVNWTAPPPCCTPDVWLGPVLNVAFSCQGPGAGDVRTNSHVCVPACW